MQNHTAQEAGDAVMNTEIGERLRQLCQMTDDMLRQMSPPDRDRMLQAHLAAARGPRRNFVLLCQMTDAFASVRRQRMAELRGQRE